MVVPSHDAHFNYCSPYLTEIQSEQSKYNPEIVKFNEIVLLVSFFSFLDDLAARKRRFLCTEIVYLYFFSSCIQYIFFARRKKVLQTDDQWQLFIYYICCVRYTEAY